MARIPGSEGLGEVVARPQNFNQTQTPRGAFGEGVGQVLGGIGADMQRQELQLERQQEIQARQAREAADKAKALGELQSAEDDLASMHDEIEQGLKTGAVPKDEAGETWQTRARERVSAAVANLPDEHRALGQVSLDGKVARYGRAVKGAVTLRNQQDVRSGIDQTLEYASRLYLKDPAAADAMVADTLDQLGPHSGLDAAQLGKVRQGFKESSRFTAASALVNGARRDNKALADIGTRLQGDEFADMDPQRRTQLLTTLEGYSVANVQRAEADARRRQADAERVTRLAESQFNAAQSIISTGKVLSPEYVEQVSKAVSGTPYELALREALKQGPENAAFGTQPLAQQAIALRQARAQLNQTGTDPKTEKRVAELERIHEQAKRDYAEDPLIAAQERGIVQAVAPLQITDLPTLAATLGERVGQAQIVSQQVGETVSPLLKAEAEQVAKLLTVLPVEQRASAVAQLAQVVGPQQAAALGRQMAPKDKALGIALGMAGAKTTAGRYTSELVLRGSQAMKDKAVQPDNKAITGIRAQVAAEIGTAYANDELRQTMIEAAVLAEYGLQAEGSGDTRRAVNLVTGGITERNGRKVPLPYGIKEDEFDKRLRAVTPAALAAQLPDGAVYAGGTKIDADAFVGSLPDAVLVHAGQGRYAVQAGGALVTNAKGRPVIVEVR